MESNYTVYLHLNKINGKRYYGVTSLKPKNRWANGKGYPRNKHFTDAINLYGWENFEHIIVAKGLTKEEAGWIETVLIAEYDSTNKDKGYNISLGGNSIGKHSQESKEKMSENRKGKCCGESNHFYGKHHTEESKNKISEANKGHTVSEERKREMSEAMKGENNPMKNPKSRKKLSEAKKGKKRPEISGEKHYMYGRRGELNPMYGKKRPEVSGKNNPSAKSVICITTNMIFDTMKEGGEFYSIKSYNNITNCCKGKQNYCGEYNGQKLVWRYITIIEL